MARPILEAAHFHNEEAAFAHVESVLWPDGPSCPHCGNADAIALPRCRAKPLVLACTIARNAASRSPCAWEPSFVVASPPASLAANIHLMCGSKKVN